MFVNARRSVNDILCWFSEGGAFLWAAENCPVWTDRTFVSGQHGKWVISPWIRIHCQVRLHKIQILSQVSKFHPLRFKERNFWKSELPFITIRYFSKVLVFRIIHMQKEYFLDWDTDLLLQITHAEWDRGELSSFIGNNGQPRRDRVWEEVNNGTAFTAVGNTIWDCAGSWLIMWFACRFTYHFKISHS